MYTRTHGSDESRTYGTSHAKILNRISGRAWYTYKRLQAVLRSAARLWGYIPSFAIVCRTPCDVIFIGWTFQTDVRYKLCTMAYMCQHEMAPVYLRRHCVPTMTIMGREQLRSASTRVLSVPRTRTVKFSRSGFYFAGPSAWNSLPVRFRQLPTFDMRLSRKTSKLITLIYIYNYLWMHPASSV